MRDFISGVVIAAVVFFGAVFLMDERSDSVQYDVVDSRIEEARASIEKVVSEVPDKIDFVMPEIVLTPANPGRDYEPDITDVMVGGYNVLSLTEGLGTFSPEQTQLCKNIYDQGRMLEVKSVVSKAVYEKCLSVGEFMADGRYVNNYPENEGLMNPVNHPDYPLFKNYNAGWSESEWSFCNKLKDENQMQYARS